MIIRPYKIETEAEIRELRETFWKGRMDMLFGLTAVGKIKIEQAAEIAEMDVGEALDMLEGWKIAHSGEEL